MLVVAVVGARRDNCTACPSLAVATVIRTTTMTFGWKTMTVVVVDRDMLMLMVVAIAEHGCWQETPHWW